MGDEHFIHYSNVSILVSVYTGTKYKMILVSLLPSELPLRKYQHYEVVCKEKWGMNILFIIQMFSILVSVYTGTKYKMILVSLSPSGLPLRKYQHYEVVCKEKCDCICVVWSTWLMLKFT